MTLNQAATGGRTNFKLPDDDDALILELKRRKDVAVKARPDGRARMNISYILGHQWVTWDPGSSRLRRATDRPGSINPMVRVTVNKIGGIVERSVATITKQNPVPGARPVSADADDVEGAQVAERILNHEFDRVDFPTVNTETYFWVEGAGWAYWHVYWDPDEGADAGEFTPQEGNEDDASIFAQLASRFTRRGGEVNGSVPLKQGEVMLDIVPHFELVVDPNARTMDDARWCIRTVAMTREAVWEEWDQVPEGAEPARTLSDELRELSDPFAATGEAGQKSKIDDQVYVHTFWCVPGTRQAPSGKVVTWCGNTVLEKKSWPYKKMRKLPFVQINFLPGMGTREGRTWVSDLVPMQKDYNDASSRLAMIRRSLSPHIVAPRGSLDRRTIGTRVSIIDYRDVGAKPDFMMPDGSWMAPHVETLSIREQEMNDRAGVSDVSQGQTDSGVTAAAAIMALQEADDRKLAVAAKELAKALSELGWMWLMVCNEMWTEERFVRTFSEDGGEPEVERYRGSDIPEQLDIRIDSSSLLPQTRAAQIALAQFLIEHQLMTDPRVIMRVLTMPGLDSINEFLSRPSQQARREAPKLNEGQIIMPAQWHDHAVHMQEHGEEMMTEEWEQRPAEIRAAWLTHYQQHEQFAAAAAANMAGMVPGDAGPNRPPSPGLGSGSPSGIDPTTGKPPDPLDVAAGLSPGQGTGANAGPAGVMQQAAGIGGPGQPGRVPGIPLETQAGQMGA